MNNMQRQMAGSALGHTKSPIAPTEDHLRHGSTYEDRDKLIASLRAQIKAAQSADGCPRCSALKARKAEKMRLRRAKS